MEIRVARKEELAIVKKMTHTTINEVYPHYYPKGAVEFFLSHHNDYNIMKDINDSNVFLLDDGEIVATVTIVNNEISRLFVLPEFQGKGYGKALLSFSEREIAKNHDTIKLDASFPAREMYVRNGYKTISLQSIKTDNEDYLCYDVMEKSII